MSTPSASFQLCTQKRRAESFPWLPRLRLVSPEARVLTSPAGAHARPRGDVPARCSSGLTAGTVGKATGPLFSVLLTPWAPGFIAETEGSSLQRLVLGSLWLSSSPPSPRGKQRVLPGDILARLLRRPTGCSPLSLLMIKLLPICVAPAPTAPVSPTDVLSLRPRALLKAAGSPTAPGLLTS